jgi:hypothetical protein
VDGNWIAFFCEKEVIFFGGLVLEDVELRLRILYQSCNLEVGSNLADGADFFPPYFG